MLILIGYNSDVICLQEVDRKIFQHDLLPSLDLLGFTGSLKTKGEVGSEGVAMFVQRDKFRCVIVLQHYVTCMYQVTFS